MFKRILLATDGSPSIERGVLYAGHLARIEQAIELVVLHVYEPPERYTSCTGYNDLVDQYRAVAGALVDEAVQQLLQDGIQSRGELRIGAAADAIIAAANEYDIDLIIMGTRSSTSGNIENILGSVTQHVLRRSRCPVLQIP